MIATTVTSMGDDSWDIPIGAPVITADGRRLGVVTDADINGILVEDGFFIRHMYTVPLADVQRYEDGSLVLKHTREESESYRHS